MAWQQRVFRSGPQWHKAHAATHSNKALLPGSVFRRLKVHIGRVMTNVMQTALDAGGEIGSSDFCVKAHAGCAAGTCACTK